MGDVNARNSLFYCFLETPPSFSPFYGGNSNSNVPSLPSCLVTTLTASNSNCPTGYELFALKSVLFRLSPTHARTSYRVSERNAVKVYHTKCCRLSKVTSFRKETWTFEVRCNTRLPHKNNSKKSEK